MSANACPRCGKTLSVRDQARGNLSVLLRTAQAVGHAPARCAARGGRGLRVVPGEPGGQGERDAAAQPQTGGAGPHAGGRQPQAGGRPASSRRRLGSRRD